VASTLDLFRDGASLLANTFGVGFIDWLGDGFILHHQNGPAAVSGHICARGNGTPHYYCRADSMCRQLDYPRPRKGSCPL